MDKAQKLAAVKRWEAAMLLADDHLGKLGELMGLSPKGGTCTAVDNLMQTLTAATSDLINDEFEWLAWYWLENDMGRKGLECSNVGGTLKPERTVEDLLALIEAMA